MMFDHTQIQTEPIMPGPRRASAWEAVGTAVAHRHDALAAMRAAGLTGWDIRKVAQSGMDVTRRA